VEVTAAQVKALREKTGAGMMDCKAALVSSAGDMEGAIRHLREKGLATAAKRAGKVAAEGLLVACSVSPGEAVMLELNCETDFVAKTPQFQALAERLLGVVAGCKRIDGATDAAAIDFDGMRLSDGASVGDAIADGVASMGESVVARRMARLAPEGGVVGFYVHAGGKIGVLIEARTSASGEACAAVERLLRDVAMQVAAANPRFTRRDEVSASELEKEREIYREQAAQTGKPEKVVEKIVEGKIEKFFAEFCLVEQEYIRDSSLTVGKLVDQTSKTVGSPVELGRFVRMQLGESSADAPGA
jgi:elongation factor Ts